MGFKLEVYQLLMRIRIQEYLPERCSRCKSLYGCPTVPSIRAGQEDGIADI